MTGLVKQLLRLVTRFRSFPDGNGLWSNKGRRTSLFWLMMSRHCSALKKDDETMCGCHHVCRCMAGCPLASAIKTYSQSPQGCLCWL